MTISLMACGGSESKDVTADYVGVWENEYFRLTINKGGIGKYENLLSDSGESYDLNWEVSDDVLVTQIDFMGMEHKASLELSEDMSSLVIIQMGFPAYVEGEETFTKQQ